MSKIASTFINGNLVFYNSENGKQIMEIDNVENLIKAKIYGETAKFGNVAGGNYLEVEADGTLKFNGNATTYNDLPPIPLLVQRVGGANNPTLAAFVGNVYAYTFAVGDYVFGMQEILHEYKQASDIECHVHWATNGSEVTDKYVKWELEYSIANLNTSEPYSTTASTFAASTVLSTEVKIPANTATKTHIYTDIGTNISGTNIRFGSIIAYRFRRIASSGTAPAADPFALSIGFHIEQDTMGSRTELTK